MASPSVDWKLRIEMETSTLTRYFEQLSRRTKRGMSQVLQKEAPVAARYIASVSAPMDGYHPGTLTKADQTAGRNAIKWDLLGRKSGEGIVSTASAAAIRKQMKWFGAYQRNEYPKGWERAISVLSSLDLYDPSGRGLKAHHAKWRSKSTGRVTRANRVKAEFKRVGTWRVQDKMFVTPATFNRYLKELWRKVGGIRAGWWWTVAKYGGTGWPSWVKTAAGGRGTQSDRTLMEVTPHIVLHNFTAHAASREKLDVSVARGLREYRKRLARSVRFKLQQVWR